MNLQNEKLKVGICQMVPVWLNKKATIQKVLSKIDEAAQQACQLLVFGEAMIPGYPFWVEHTDGAKFNNDLQKEIFALYAQEAIEIEKGDLNPLCQKAKETKMALYVGTIEKATDRGGHSLYCSLVYINPQGEIASVHRKLMPTYEERLVWSIGDGNGLRVHPLGNNFKVGGLNCWENWMPLTRAALYAQGENIHVAVWPGNERNTIDLTPVIAKESRSYVISVSGLFRKKDIPDSPYFAAMQQVPNDYFANGGSCIAHPDGTWLIAPQVGEEVLLFAELEHQKIREERQNFDPSGHYSRPDVLRLSLNRERQAVIDIKD